MRVLVIRAPLVGFSHPVPHFTRWEFRTARYYAAISAPLLLLMYCWLILFFLRWIFVFCTVAQGLVGSVGLLFRSQLVCTSKLCSMRNNILPSLPLISSSSAGALYEPSCREIEVRGNTFVGCRPCSCVDLALLIVVFSILYGVVLVLGVR